MPFCDENNWYEDVKCCMDGYSIEHVLDVAHENDLWDLPEVVFLDEYPCVNGPEIDSLADKIAESIPDKQEDNQQPQFPSFECITQTIFDGLKKALPQPLLDSVKPYLCRE